MHLEKNHQRYMNGANAIFEKLNHARRDNVNNNARAMLKEFTCHIGGHMLHSTFCDCMAPPTKAAANQGIIADRINKEHASLDLF